MAKLSEQEWLAIENAPPKRVKQVNSWMRVFKNHPKWTYPYSLEVKSGRTWGILSQHRTMSGAMAASKRALRKYRSGEQALLEG